LSEGPELDRVIALAGLFQAAALVRQVAQDGSAEPEAFQASVGSVLRLDADSTETIFGGRDGVRLGLRELCRQLDRQSSGRDAELMRYALSLMFLERKLMKRKDLLETLHEGVRAAAEQAEHFSPTHSNVLARLADLYLKTVSTLTPRIVVTGDPSHLNNPENANRIRCALLAGMRAVVLWRQVGGNRLRLLFGRRRVIRTAQAVLAELEA